MSTGGPGGALLRVALFVLLVVAAYVGLGAYLLDLSGGGGFARASGDVSVAAGEAIFNGKGKCSTCHSIGELGSAVRCPNLGVKAGSFAQPVGVRAARRRPGTSAIQYIVESIYDPNAFVVPGYPRGVMPRIHRPPVALSEDEIRSVVLFLLDQSGVAIEEGTEREISSAQRGFAGRSGDPEAVTPVRVPPGEPEDGKRVFVRMQCPQCHVVRGVELDASALPGGVLPRGGVGPELTGIGAIQSSEYLFESILNPSAVILPDPSPGQKYSEGGASKMPEYHDLIKLRELVDLVAFLKTLTETPVAPR